MQQRGRQHQRAVPRVEAAGVVQPPEVVQRRRSSATPGSPSRCSRSIRRVTSTRNDRRLSMPVSGSVRVCNASSRWIASCSRTRNTSVVDRPKGAARHPRVQAAPPPLRSATGRCPGVPAMRGGRAGEQAPATGTVRSTRRPSAGRPARHPRIAPSTASPGEHPAPRALADRAACQNAREPPSWRPRRATPRSHDARRPPARAHSHAPRSQPGVGARRRATGQGGRPAGRPAASRRRPHDVPSDTARAVARRDAGCGSGRAPRRRSPATPAARPCRRSIPTLIAATLDAARLTQRRVAALFDSPGALRMVRAHRQTGALDSMDDTALRTRIEAGLGRPGRVSPPPRARRARRWTPPWTRSTPAACASPAPAPMAGRCTNG